jgi:hypothetical protein
MANTIAYKRTILKVRKPVRFLVRPRAINFFKNGILSRDPVSFGYPIWFHVWMKKNAPVQSSLLPDLAPNNAKLQY